MRIEARLLIRYYEPLFSVTFARAVPRYALISSKGATFSIYTLEVRICGCHSVATTGKEKTVAYGIAFLKKTEEKAYVTGVSSMMQQEIGA